MNCGYHAEVRDLLSAVEVLPLVTELAKDCLTLRIGRRIGGGLAPPIWLDGRRTCGGKGVDEAVTCDTCGWLFDRCDTFGLASSLNGGSKAGSLILSNGFGVDAPEVLDLLLRRRIKAGGRSIGF